MVTQAEKRAALVLGASGRVGRLVLPALRHIAPDRDWIATGRDEFPADLQAKAVVALWGVTTGDDATLALNLTLAARAQEIADRVGADRVLHMSSIAVYDPAIDHPDEGAPLDTGLGYGAAKVAMERYLTRAPGPRPVVLRLGNVVGADSLAPALIDRHARIAEFPDGHGPRRSMIAPGDLAKVIEALCASAPENLPEVLNVAAPEAVDMIEIARAAGCDVETFAAPENARAMAHMSTLALARRLPDLLQSLDAAAMTADWRRWAATT